MDGQDLETLIAGMRADFLRDAGLRVRAIRSEADSLALGVSPAGPVARLIREAHTLKGGSAIFGFASLGEAGAEVERCAKLLGVTDSPRLPPAELAAAIEALEHVFAGIRTP
jgi:chemotaxis protein histidine kinase CheA